MTAQPATQNPTFTEAPASWTARYIMQGYDCMLTLRGETGADLLQRSEAALKWLTDHGATPQAAKANNNGGQAAPTLPDGSPDPAFCAIHGVSMKRHEQDGQAWYSHRLADNSYCKGKKK